MKETIYVGIPSLEDSELVHTVIDCFESASHPDRIFVGIAYSTDLNNIKLRDKLIRSLKNYPQVSYVFLNWKTNYGAGNGRIAAAKKYSGQNYFLQIDSHMKFQDNWDEYMIDKLQNSFTILKSNKIVISGYPSAYFINSNKERILEDPLLKLRCPVYMQGTLMERFNIKNEYMNMMPNWGDEFPEIIWKDLDKEFYPAPKVAGGLVFGGKKFAENYSKWYPYPPMFYDEEIIQSVELINDGFLIVCPQTSIPISHLYVKDINEYGGYRKHLDARKSTPFYQNYINYINSNKEKIKKYKEYSGVNLLTKEIEFDMVMPDIFKSKENKYDK